MTNLGMQEFMKAIVSGNTIQSHVFEISLCNSSGHILYFMTVFEELYYMQTWYSKQCFAGYGYHKFLICVFSRVQ